MKEEFLHFIWEFSLFDSSNLVAVSGEKIEIIAIGQHNTNAGPDFFNAKIKIGDTLWAGNVEVHLRSSDWKRHEHSENKAYDNVILHVVKENDSPIFRANGELLPTLVLRYNSDIEKHYEALLQSTSWIACEKKIANIELFRVKHFLSRLLAERLERKAQQIYEVLQTTHNDWREAFYQLLFRSFGFGVNALPFELLAKHIPLAAIGKHRHSLIQMEALLFGQAGFLNEETKDEYQQTLQKEYQFLQTKFSLTAMESHIWKFLRLRPSNFPTVRIAQLAKLLHQSEHLIDKIINFRNIDELVLLFTVQASEYWDTHYSFGKISRKSTKTIGVSSAQRIIANLIVPYLFAFGREQADEKLCDKAIELLEALPPEKNHITNRWAEIGIYPENAFYSQALIQLKTTYCEKKECLKCAIGAGLLKRD